MGLERIWQHSWNNGPSSGSTNALLSASQLFFMKQLLLGAVPLTDLNGNSIASPSGVWTVYGSSDSSTSGLDGVDRTGSTFNSAKWVSATTGTAHTWLVLKSPTTGFGPGCYLIIDYSNASGVNYVNIAVCKTAPTGGSITTKPTTTDSTAYQSKQLNDGTTTPFVFSGILSTIGDFAMFAQKTGSAQAQFCLLGSFLAQAKTGDLFPYAFYSEYGTSAAGVPSGSQIAATNYWFSRYPDNSGGDGTTAGQFGAMTANGGIGAIYNGFPSTGDGQDSSFADWPLLMSSYASNGASHGTVRGRLVDFKSATLDGSNNNNGKTEPTSGTPSVTTTILGALWWPANTVPVL